MRSARWIAAILALSAASCTDRATLTPANPSAQAIGAPVFSFARGLPGGVMNIRMPDGESMPGTFSISEVAGGSDGKGNFSAQAAGPRTAMTCHGNISAGHGPVDCQANNGAVYRMAL